MILTSIIRGARLIGGGSSPTLRPKFQRSSNSEMGMIKLFIAKIKIKDYKHTTISKRQF